MLVWRLSFSMDLTALGTALAAANVSALTSSTGAEVSFEKPEWQHGAFTKALLDAFDDPAADIDRNGPINSNGLAAYVAHRVPTISAIRLTNKSVSDRRRRTILDRYGPARVDMDLITLQPMRIGAPWPLFLHGGADAGPPKALCMAQAGNAASNDDHVKSHGRAMLPFNGLSAIRVTS